MCAYCGFCISASYRLRLLRQVLIVQMIIESLLRNDRRKLSRFPVPGQSSCLCQARLEARVTACQSVRINPRSIHTTRSTLRHLTSRVRL